MYATNCDWVVCNKKEVEIESKYRSCHPVIRVAYLLLPLFSSNYFMSVGFHNSGLIIHIFMRD